ncbi:MAG: ARPP-1 family domain-containing protein, partial [Phycisphaerae bacterium]
DYTRDLGKIIDEHNDAVGTVVVINGKLNCADVYGSNQLFKKLWPKMLKASAIEAISEHDLSRTTEPPAIEAVHAFLSNAEGGKSRAQEVSSRITCVTKETNDNILFETIDKKGKTGWVHRSYLNKVYKGREDAQPPSTGNANSVQGQMPDIEPED